jgi:EmrB/QacA subfamily drug resistance transporter
VRSTHEKGIILVVAVSFFMENLDSTILATALPQIGRTFHVAPKSLGVLMSAYMLALAVFIPVSGWLADRWEPRKVFASAIALFCVSSMLCGLCWSVGSLTAARVLQGIGGAAMVPVGRLIVLKICRREDLLRVLNAVVMPGLMAPIIGPPVGGFLTTYANWRWIFLLNVPLSVIGFIYTIRYVPRFAPTPRRPFDWTGFVLSGGSLTAILAGAECVGSPGTITTGLMLVATGALLGVATLRHARSASNPLNDFSVLAVPTFAVAVITGSVTRISIGALPFLIPLMLQVGFGFSAFKSGLLFLATPVGALGMKSIVLHVVRRFGFRSTMMLNSLFVSLSYCACCLIGPTSPIWMTAIVLFTCGVARSTQNSCLNAIAFADIEKERMNAASTLYSTFQQASMGLGIAAGAMALQCAMSISGLTLHYSVENFHIAFVTMALVSLITLIGYGRMDRDAGQMLNASPVPRRN